MNRIVTFTAGFILVWIIGYLLIAGRSLLVPLVVAIFIWHLLNTIHVAVRNIPYMGSMLPKWLSAILSLLVVAALVNVLADIIGNNVTEVIAASPRYQENILMIFNHIDAYFHIKILAKLDSFMSNLSIQTLISNIYGVFTSIMSSAVLIVLYVIFLFVEQHFFTKKLDVLFPNPKHRILVESINKHIVKDTQTYLGLKTLLGLLTASGSWVIMKWVTLDFAEFWALLIFFLNFIPNIGAIVATAFPALLALVQFPSMIPCMIVTFGIVLIQFFIGNIIEPRYMSRSLNLSPLVILFSLAFWGSIWGVLGMFLSVPITVMMMIVFAHFSETRPLAILLSQDGCIQKAYE
jgi:predicted PurR-regulated permease PerM